MLCNIRKWIITSYEYFLMMNKPEIKKSWIIWWAKNGERLYFTFIRHRLYYRHHHYNYHDNSEYWNNTNMPNFVESASSLFWDNKEFLSIFFLRVFKSSRRMPGQWSFAHPKNTLKTTHNLFCTNILCAC